MTVVDRLFLKVDNSPLVVFRIIFGILLAAEAWGAIFTEWVSRAFIEPKITFPFLDFPFLQPLSGNGMIYYYILMGFFGLMVALGYKYRFAMWSYALLWAGVYFMQKTNYNNHYYLLMILNFLMCFVRGADYASLDSKLNPERLKNYCPQWNLWLFKGLILIVYFYASVAKMYPEWIEAKPIQIWFNQKSDYWLIGPLLAKSWFQYFVAWMGIGFDLLIGPALLWRRTRKIAFFSSIFFHIFNSIVFQVGVFPYLGMTFALFFFDSKKVQALFLRSKTYFNKNEILQVSNFKKYLIVSLLSVFFLFNILTPLRHHVLEGDVNWTEEGHRLSWRMMLRVKSGHVLLQIKDNESGLVTNVQLDNYLTKKQQRKLATRPDFMWQFVQILKEEYNYPKNDVSIFAIGIVSLNGARAEPLYDSSFDLTKAEWHRFKESDWLLRY